MHHSINVYVCDSSIPDSPCYSHNPRRSRMHPIDLLEHVVNIGVLSLAVYFIPTTILELFAPTLPHLQHLTSTTLAFPQHPSIDILIGLQSIPRIISRSGLTRPNARELLKPIRGPAMAAFNRLMVATLSDVEGRVSLSISGLS